VHKVAIYKKTVNIQIYTNGKFAIISTRSWDIFFKLQCTFSAF